MAVSFPPRLTEAERAGTPAPEAHSLTLRANLAESRFEWAEQCVASLLARAPSHRVADIGAGEGKMRAAVERYGASWQGFDLAPAAPGVIQWDLDEPAPARADRPGIVLLLEVVEHLRNPWRAMQNVADLLAPGGYLVLTTPNPRWSRSRMYALAQGVPACFTEDDLRVNHHVFTPWPHILARLLGDVGLTVEDYVTIDGRTQWPAGPWTLRYPIRAALAAANKLVERRDPTACGMTYGIVARRPN